MTKESKLGLFAIVVLALAIWGYRYLKGQNLLSKSYTFKTIYSDVNQLTVSSPVLFNGLTVGSVTNISVNPKDLSQMIVTYEVGKNLQIPNDAVAVQMSNGILNGKAISIKFKTFCDGSNCAKEGGFLKGKEIGILGSMVGKEELNGYVKTISAELNTVIEDLGSEDAKGAINESIKNLNQSLQNIESLTKSTDALIKKSYSGLTKTIDNMSVITGNLAANNEQITGLLNNLNTITTDIKNANVGNTVNAANATLAETQLAIKQLQTTLGNTDQMVTSIRGVINKVDSGEGSLGKLLNDQQLYTNLESTSQNLSLLLQDLRLNPKRYVNVSVFGKKAKEYTLPENDPALQPKK